MSFNLDESWRARSWFVKDDRKAANREEEVGWQSPPPNHMTVNIDDTFDM